jgi:serine/threonine-protein kinase
MNEPVRKRSQASNDWLVGQRVDRYHVLHRLAAGGMGAVYVARAVGMGGFERLVAIKVLHPHLADEEEFISMLLDEARLAARIRHPNVVATLDVSQWEDLHYLVMDYVEGDHLAGLLSKPYKAGGRLPLRPALRIIYEALAGLTVAHELTDGSGAALNLVHRDVSPQNVLVGVDGISRLTDFGVAKAEYRLSSTRQGTFKGKLAYTAPETASQAHAEQRSDLFALGVVLWEVLTTRRLFKAETNVATLRKLLEDPIPPPSSVHPELAPFDAVLKKALARPLDERFQTGAEMLEAIEKAATQTVGMGTTREVAAMVRELAADKLDKEQLAIRAAIERLGDDVPAAYSTGRHDALEEQSSPSQQPTTASGQIAGVTPEPIAPERSVPVRQVAIGLFLLFVVLGVAFAIMSDGSNEDALDVPPVAEEVPEPEPEPEPEPIPEPETHAAPQPDPNDVNVGVTTNGTADEPPEVGGPDETAASDDAEGATPRIRTMAMTMRPRMQIDEEDDVLSNPYRSN